MLELFRRWGGSSAGRASRSQCEGREFDPPPPTNLHQNPRSVSHAGFCLAIAPNSPTEHALTAQNRSNGADPPHADRPPHRLEPIRRASHPIAVIYLQALAAGTWKALPRGRYATNPTSTRHHRPSRTPPPANNPTHHRGHDNRHAYKATTRDVQRAHNKNRALMMRKQPTTCHPHSTPPRLSPSSHNPTNAPLPTPRIPTLNSNRLHILTTLRRRRTNRRPIRRRRSISASERGSGSRRRKCNEHCRNKTNLGLHNKYSPKNIQQVTRTSIRTTCHNPINP